MTRLTKTAKNPFQALKRNRPLMSVLSVLTTIAVLHLTVSCSYYKIKPVDTSPTTMAEHIRSFNQQNKYVILHSENNSWHLENIIVSEDDLSLSGVVKEVLPAHQSNVKKDSKKSFKYKKSKSQPLNEAHFYLNEPINVTVGDNLVIPFNQVSKVTINDRDTGREVASWIFGSLGIALVIAIAVLAASSCPFLYVNDGEGFQFVGELYPGIITPNIQRDDYLPLSNFHSIDREYIIKITNELKEIQHTDLAQLMVVEHEDNVRVLLDKNGKPHTIFNLISPISALIDNEKLDIEPALQKDDLLYRFNTPLVNSNSTKRTLQFEFEKPIEARDGKLLITAKNSMWLDYVYGKFNEQFGSYFNKFQEDLQKQSAEESIAWTKNQNIPLSVYIQSDNSWKLVDEINVVGPMAMRDIVIPIEFNSSVTDKLKVKLETGFMFWEVDFIGMDYSINSNTSISYIDAISAFDENGKDVTKLINKVDNNYLIQPDIGNETIIKYNIPSNINTSSSTYFLKNRGFYNYIRDYEGMPDIDRLEAFENDGAFSEFSMNKYDEIMNVEKEFLENSIK